MDISFLKAVKVTDKGKVSVRATKIKGPEGNASLRVYYNGGVYPSAQFAADFQLEYQPKVVKTAEDGSTSLVFSDTPGNGLDVFKASSYPAITTAHDFVVITAVPRNQPKLDMFKTTDCLEDGTPKSSVIDQGNTTFGKNVLLPMLKEVYGIELDKEKQPFIDLVVMGTGDDFSMPFRNENNSSVYYIPKMVTRGKEEKEYQPTTTRRENLLLWALVPAEAVAELGKITLSGPAFNADAMKATTVVATEAEGDDSDEAPEAEGSDDLAAAFSVATEA